LNEKVSKSKIPISPLTTGQARERGLAGWG